MPLSHIHIILSTFFFYIHQAHTIFITWQSSNAPAPVSDISISTIPTKTDPADKAESVYQRYKLSIFLVLICFIHKLFIKTRTDNLPLGAHDVINLANIIIQYLEKSNLVNKLSVLTANSINTDAAIDCLIGAAPDINCDNTIQVHECVAYMINLPA